MKKALSQKLKDPDKIHLSSFIRTEQE